MAIPTNIERFKLGKQVDMLVKETGNIRSAAKQLNISTGWASEARKYYKEERTYVSEFPIELKASAPILQYASNNITKILQKDNLTNKDLVSCFREIKKIQHAIGELLLSAEDCDTIQQYHKTHAAQEQIEEFNRNLYRVILGQFLFH